MPVKLVYLLTYQVPDGAKKKYAFKTPEARQKAIELLENYPGEVAWDIEDKEEIIIS